jgi:hypothetical protein
VVLVSGVVLEGVEVVAEAVAEAVVLEVAEATTDMKKYHQQVNFK